MRVGTTQGEVGRPRLHKCVVTRKATTDREPITEGNVDDAILGKPISEKENEAVLLHIEQAVYQTGGDPGRPRASLGRSRH